MCWCEVTTRAEKVTKQYLQDDWETMETAAAAAPLQMQYNKYLQQCGNIIHMYSTVVVVVVVLRGERQGSGEVSVSGSRCRT